VINEKGQECTLRQRRCYIDSGPASYSPPHSQEWGGERAGIKGEGVSREFVGTRRISAHALPNLMVGEKDVLLLRWAKAEKDSE
jgi:hypothetical protein